MTQENRYHRQQLLPGIGSAGQSLLANSTALIVGCGALGSVSAELLTRAGVGRIILVDRDILEWTNLQRQILYTEDDVIQNLPKAHAAKTHLTRINSTIQIDAHAVDFTSDNAESLAASADILIDGTDNFTTRFLLNDLAVKHSKPYIYAGAVGTRGMVFPILPGASQSNPPVSPHITANVTTPCLRCLFPDPPTQNTDTCDTVGVLGPAVTTIASIQTTEAIKVLTHNWSAVNCNLLEFDLWTNQSRSFSPPPPLDDCPCCALRNFELLNTPSNTYSARMCGRNAVQICASNNTTQIDFTQLHNRFAQHAAVNHNDHLLRAQLNPAEGGYDLTIFPDGRAIIHGTDHIPTAKSIYAKFIGL